MAERPARTKDAERPARTKLAAFTQRRNVPLARVEALGEAVACLPELSRAAAILIWQRRHANEQASVALGVRMQAFAVELALGHDIGAALARLIADEHTHVHVAADILRALSAPLTLPQEIRTPSIDERRELSLARDIVVGLALCETVSAARFVAVRAATDVPAFRAVIDGFLRDEVAHAGLGFVLVPTAKDLVAQCLGAEDAAIAWIVHEFVTAIAELERAVGLDGARRGLAPARAQPTPNAGVIEPNLDAHAFYAAVRTRILPRLDACGIPATRAWDARFSANRASTA